MIDLNMLREKIIDLRKSGHTYSDIAATVGLTHPTVMRFLKDDKKLMFETVRKLYQYVDGNAESELEQKSLAKRTKGLK